jgi:Coenzyme PQQ synthesis protein D (PqqD)
MIVVGGSQGGISMSADNAAEWRPKTQFLEADVGTELSLYDPSTERVVVLNQTASDIWRLLDGHTSTEQIVDLLATFYRTEANTIRKDVESVLAKFEEEGLVDQAVAS